MSDGCAACGARQVGPPLVRPERELPSYAYAIGAVAAGFVLVAACAAAFVSTLLQFEFESLASFDAQMLLRVAEKTAWRLKWTALPLSLVAVWATARFSRGVRREPARFAGLRFVRAGLVASSLVAAALLTLIGVTVPERLERRELARRAAGNVLLHASHQLLSEYRKRFNTLPASVADLRKLDDPDCTFAQTIAELELGDYKPETDLASLSPQIERSRKTRRPARVRNASARSTDDLPDANLSLTNYELALPGRDKILGTEDDLRIRDGLIIEASKEAGGAAAARPLASAKKN
ncbi:MAG TPA: hypothetical protein VF064_10760 [Pyrinomonadaceae bacterium]